MTPNDPNPEIPRPAPVPGISIAAANAPQPGPGEVAPAQLTPEEQMALFEKELKETDWGHQPC